MRWCRLLACFLLLTQLAGVATAERPPLSACVSRLLEHDPEWKLSGITGLSTDINPGDGEVGLRHLTNPQAIYLVGARDAIRYIYTELGPLAPNSQQGKKQLSDGVRTLAATAGVPNDEVRGWVRDNWTALLEGAVAAVGKHPARTISGRGQTADGRLTLSITVAFDDPPAPRGILKFEELILNPGDWSPTAIRSYKHPSGLRLSFDEDAISRRVVMEYLPSNPKQTQEFGIAIAKLGLSLGQPKDSESNLAVIRQWLESPETSMELIGATCRIGDGEDGTVLITVRESD